MRTTTLLRIALLSLAAPLARAANDNGWLSLKAGMTPAETSALLGFALVGSKARDFEIGIYDGRAEVVFLRGQLVAWTGPATAPSAPPPANAWRFDQQWRSRAGTRAIERGPEARVEAPRRGTFLPSYRL